LPKTTVSVVRTSASQPAAAARHYGLGHGAILEHVELHPMAPAGAFGNRLEPQRRDCALNEGDAETGGGARKCEIAPLREETARSGRRDGERERQFPAEDFY
jgi:hypothetical protein